METITRPEIPASALRELQQHGWAIAQVVGMYCVAWRGNDEITLTWSGEGWQVVSIRTRRLAA